MRFAWFSIQSVGLRTASDFFCRDACGVQIRIEIREAGRGKRARAGLRAGGTAARGSEVLARETPPVGPARQHTNPGTFRPSPTFKTFDFRFWNTNLTSVDLVSSCG